MVQQGVKEIHFFVAKDNPKATRTKEIFYVVANNGCWNCVSHKKNKDGYPIVKRNRIGHTIHNYIYTLLNGNIDNGMVVRHKCDNPTCINPEHLEIGTQLDNINDMSIRGRRSGAKGERNCHHKLTVKEVLDIRDSDDDYKILMNKYNVSASTIHNILGNRTWRNIL